MSGTSMTVTCSTFFKSPLSPANTTLSSYFNDIIIHFYEDTALIESTGRQLGIDVNHDYFLAISFLYPSDMVVSCENKCRLMELLTPVLSCGPLNSTIDSPQFLACDKGILFFLMAHTKEELLNANVQVCEKAIRLLEENFPDTFIRIGIDTIENGLSGIERSYQNSIHAIDAGEQFKKERRILDFIGMEIYSAMNAIVLAHGQTLISTILLQLSKEKQRR